MEAGMEAGAAGRAVGFNSVEIWDKCMEADSDQLPLEEKAYRLHLQGKPVREISRIVGKHKNTVQNWINRIRAENAERYKANREQLIAERVEKLEHIYALALADHDITPDAAYLNTARACETDIAKLFGLAQMEENAPSRLTVTVRYVDDWRKTAVTAEGAE